MSESNPLSSGSNLARRRLSVSTAKHAAGIKQMSALGWRHSMPRRLQRGREAAGLLNLCRSPTVCFLR